MKAKWLGFGVWAWMGAVVAIGTLFGGGRIWFQHKALVPAEDKSSSRHSFCLEKPQSGMGAMTQAKENQAIPFSDAYVTTGSAKDYAIAELSERLRRAVDPDDVELVAQELAQTQSSEGVAALIRVIRDTPEADKRGKIGRAFQFVDTPASAIPIIDALTVISNDYVVLAALRECAPRVFDPSAVVALVDFLEMGDWEEWQRSNLLGCLAEVRKPSCVDVLTEVVRGGSTNLDVQEQAVIALAEIGDKEALARLLEMAGDSAFDELHDHIFYMIGNMSNKDMFNRLANHFLSSTNEQLRYATARALANVLAEKQQDSDQDEGDGWE